MRDLSDRFHQLISFMKPISLSASQCQVIIRVRDENDESLRVTECHVYLGIMLSVQTDLDLITFVTTCYNTSRSVTLSHVTRITSHFTLFVHRITIVYLI